MNFGDSSSMRRSISMPVKPRPLKAKSLQRSKEKETIYEADDYYPESPAFIRHKKFTANNEINEAVASRSDSNLPYTSDWAGSTIELNKDDLRRNESDTLCARKRPYRVIEKNGHENVIFRCIPEKSWRYLRDFVTTLVRPLLRFLPKKCVTQTESNSKSMTPPITPNSSFISQHPNSNENLEINKRRAKELDALDWIDKTDSSSERVKFTLYS